MTVYRTCKLYYYSFKFIIEFYFSLHFFSVQSFSVVACFVIFNTFVIYSFVLTSKMPKNKQSISSVLSKYVNEFGKNVFSSDGSALFCKLCEVRVSADRRYTVTHHLKTDKHSRAINRHQNATTSKVQQQLTLCSKKSTFSKHLCQTLLSANIPLNKVNNEDFRLFLEKYTKKEIPDESTLRKSYVF